MRKNLFFFRESMDYLMRISWVAPYLLVPPLLAFLVYVEDFLAWKGLAVFHTPDARLTIALWNATLLLTLITGIRSCFFFSRFFSGKWFLNALSLPVRKSSGFWGPFLAVLLISSAAYVLTMAAILAALPFPVVFPWVATIISTFVPILWAVCLGIFLGMLTSGGASAYMFVVVMVISLLVGLPVNSNPFLSTLSHVLPPLGKSIAGSLRNPFALDYSVLLLFHSMMSMFAGALLYCIRARKN